MDKSTAQTIVKVYAVLAWIGAFFSLIGGIIMLFAGSFMGSLGLMSGMMEGLMFGSALGALGLITGIIMIAFAVLYFYTGLGLWKGRNWARILVIIASVLELFSFPIGTIIGAFGIWFFGFSKDAKKLFK